jgi:hypothetical protein
VERAYYHGMPSKTAWTKSTQKNGKKLSLPISMTATHSVNYIVKEYKRPHVERQRTVNWLCVTKPAIYRTVIEAFFVTATGTPG